ncbi:hypothetical protein CFBP5507_06105 [Agrobacterium salinitolerans]|uniref:Uncharacterized protein n=1 Tax=Agrobacterium salinitolerans TaxID=1183413 RepID=A0A4Z1RD21_9HYPH|nr:hypothetical protein [Agrobacterium salinitolerans]UYZ08572.1 hypothetical protein CFBP5507_06105 [Agrobacterium salinitolerans]
MSEHDFHCRECHAPTPIAAADGSPLWCEECCPDHEYEYQRGEGNRCIHCNAEPPDDWYEVDFL